jgi:hypothetical protein
LRRPASRELDRLRPERVGGVHSIASIKIDSPCQSVRESQAAVPPNPRASSLLHLFTTVDQTRLDWTAQTATLAIVLGSLGVP